MSGASSAPSFSNIFRALATVGAIGICLLAALVWGQAPAADSEKAIAGPRQAAATAASAQSQAPAAVVEFTPDGKLKQPVGYRKWVHVGTPVTPKDMNGGDESISDFHAVYMDPESFAPRRPSSSVTAPSWSKNSAALGQRRRLAARATSWANTRV